MMVPSDDKRHTPVGRENTLSSRHPLAELRPNPRPEGFPVKEAAVPNTLFAGQGRPRKDDAARRKGVFLTLMAEGHDAVTARKRAGINPDRALRIVTESDFRAILQALRDGAGPVAVILDPDAGKVAA